MIDLQRPLLNTVSTGRATGRSSALASWLWLKRWFIAASMVTLMVILTFARGLSWESLWYPTISLPADTPLLGPFGAGIVRPLESEEARAVHPLLELIQRGRDTALQHDQIRESIRSLEDAARDYKTAFGLDPPEGFDQWYTFNVQVGATTAPSLIPLAVDSIQPYLAMPPLVLRKRAGELLDFTGMMAFEFASDPRGEGCVMDMVSVDEVSKHRHFAQDYPSLLGPILRYLPPPQNGPMLLKTWTEDNAFRIPSGGILDRSREMAKRGEVWDEAALLAAEAEQDGKLGWGEACDPAVTGSAANQSLSEMGAAIGGSPGWISDPVVYMDHCKHPEHLLQEKRRNDHESRHGSETLGANDGGEQGKRRTGGPSFDRQLFRGSEMLGAPTRSATRIVEQPLAWKDKSDDRLFFRGAPTGIFHSKLWDWRSSQRDRLAVFCSESKARGKGSRILMRNKGKWDSQTMNRQDLIKQYLDLGLVPKDIGWNCGRWSGFIMCGRNGNETVPNCPGDYFSCLEMLDEHEWKPIVPFDESLKYKYHLDVDGFGWTTRFRTELSTGSVIFKATLYHEWWSAQLIPWYHYVPVRYDYGDVFDTMAFFAGQPNTREFGRDDLAQEIGFRGRHFAMHRMRWEDMQSYMLLMLLEYRRAWSDDRGSASFKGRSG